MQVFIHDNLLSPQASIALLPLHLMDVKVAILKGLKCLTFEKKKELVIALSTYYLCVILVNWLIVFVIYIFELAYTLCPPIRLYFIYRI